MSVIVKAAWINLRAEIETLNVAFAALISTFSKLRWALWSLRADRVLKCFDPLALTKAQRLAIMHVVSRTRVIFLGRRQREVF